MLLIKLTIRLQTVQGTDYNMTRENKCGLEN